MINLFKNLPWYIIEGACTVLLSKLKYIPEAKKVCEKSVRDDQFAYIIDKLKTQCEKSVGDDPDRYQDQGICNWAVYKNPWMLEYIPNHFKNREICDETV